MSLEDLAALCLSCILHLPRTPFSNYVRKCTAHASGATAFISHENFTVPRECTAQRKHGRDLTQNAAQQTSDSPRRTPKVRMARSFGHHSQELLELFSTVPSPRPCHRSFMIIDLAFYSCDERLARLAFVNSKTCRRASRKRSLVQNILKFAPGRGFPQAWRATPKLEMERTVETVESPDLC